MIPVPADVSAELATDVVNTVAWRGAGQTATAAAAAADPEFYVGAWIALATLILELPKVPWAEALAVLHELRAAGQPGPHGDRQCGPHRGDVPGLRLPA